MWHRIPVYDDRDSKVYRGEYVAYGEGREMNIIMSYIEDIILKVEFEDKTTISGYWHDNQNYPFSDVRLKQVIVDKPAEINRLVEALQLTNASPSTFFDKMKSLFTTQDSFIAFLDSHQIQYELKPK